mmetsp:Transcript_72895/g.202239  ORF Transcript_72895/g.202239 Transcript_72895/m.202239 type:complete len:319 (+) Transcript_72895:369-1325(+)
MLEGADDVLECFCVEATQAAITHGFALASVRPFSPKHSLRYPLTCAHGGGLRGVLHAIAQGPTAHEIHFRMDRGLAQIEQDFTGGGRIHRGCLMADLVHRVRVFMHVPAEVRVHRKHLLEELKVEIHAEGFRDDIEQLDLAFGHEGLLLAHCVLGVFLHPHSEAVGNLVLREVPAKGDELLRLGVRKHFQLRHRRRQATHEKRGHEEGNDERGHGVNAFAEVLRPDFVHATAELRKRPMQGDDVAEEQVFIGEAPRTHPGLVFSVVLVAYAIPEARDDMGEADHSDDDLRNVHDYDEALRTYPLGDEHDYFPDADEPQ